MTRLVSTTSSGAWTRLWKMTPDVIFIDLLMPRIGGDDLCRIIRNMDHLQNCYLAIVTGVVLEQHLDYRQLGADALIAKGPFSEMRRHILKALNDSENPRRDVIVPVLQGADNLHIRQVSRELLLDAMAATPPEPQENPAPIHLNGYQVTLEPYTLAGTPPSTILMLFDITERRQMEAVIEAANLTKNLGCVFSEIRHETGNPVNSIKMALSVLQRNLAEYDRDTIAVFLDRSLQEVTGLEYLLKALKNYSLFERPVMQKLPVAGFICDFIALIRNDFENHHIKIHRILPDNGLLVFADSRSLHHIMLNLITNAADALVDCHNPQIIVSACESRGQVEIKVDDNGKGISGADQQNLFKPFFTSKPTGTGLGLVIVKKMLLAMNGKISFESYQGMGTTVTLTLPGVDK